MRFPSAKVRFLFRRGALSVRGAALSARRPAFPARYGNGGAVQKVIAGARAKVGLDAPVIDAPRRPIRRDLIPPRNAAAHLPKWRERPAR